MSKFHQSLTFCFLLFSNFAFGQAPELVWQKFFGGSKNDYLSDVIQKESGGFIISSSTFSNDGDCILRQNDQNYDTWLFDLDESGIIRKSTFPRIPVNPNFSYSMSPGRLLDLKNGEFWVGGYFDYVSPYAIKYDANFTKGLVKSGIGGIQMFKFDESLFTFSNNLSRNHDLSFKKYDLNWNNIFDKNFGGDQREGVRTTQTILNKENKFYFISETESNNNGDVGLNNASLYKSDIWLVCTDLNGIILWQKSLGNINVSEGVGSIINHKDGSALVLGSKLTYDGYDIILYKIDNLGNIIWNKTYGGNYSDYPKYIIQDLDGGYLILSESSSTSGQVSQNFGLKDCWLFKINMNGDFIWGKTFGGNNYDEVNKIFIDKSGDYYIFGTSQSTDFPISNHHGLQDVWVMKLQNFSCTINNDLMLNTDFSSFSKFKTSGKVSISSKLLNNQGLFISAKQSILLSPGFETKINSNATLQIKGCEN